MQLTQCTLALLIACGCALAQERPTVRTEGYITVTAAHSAWFLTIRSDGSATIACGASIENNRQFKAGTFDFGATFRRLARVEKTKGGEGHHHIQMQFDGKAAEVAFSTKDSDVVLPMFAHAYRSLSAKDRGPNFEEAWRNAPPGGKAKPAPTKEQPPAR